MTRKYYESARKFRDRGAYHADLMRVARLHIDAVRYANRKLEAYR